MAAQIDILLATYNSSAYLFETIDSILQQDFTDWRLLISDGGSTDSTVKIIDQYAQRNPDKIAVVSSDRALSVCENFSWLLTRSDSDYVMFCDHDDVWLSDKISKTIKVMKQTQLQYDREVPLLVFTDMKVVDENLRVLSDSSLDYQNLNPKRLSLNQLILQNVPSGCSMMMNRSLANLSRPIPTNAAMHDHWISLVAATFGRIIFLDEATLLYRQHGSNVYGASSYGWMHFYRRYRQGVEAARDRLDHYIDQAAAFYDRYARFLEPKHCQMLEELSRWNEFSWLERRQTLLKYQILKTGFRRNLGMFLIV